MKPFILALLSLLISVNFTQAQTKQKLKIPKEKETPASSPTPTPVAEKPQEKRKPQDPEKVQDKKKKTGIMKLNKKGLVNLDFVDAEIGEVAKSISELTNRNFILDDKVRGKITIISPKPVTLREAYRAFVSALEVKNYTVIRIGRVSKIVPLRDMKSRPLPTDVSYASGGDDVFVTRLIPIQYTRSSEIAKSLRGLISKNGDMISYDPTNTLIITDSVGNLRRLMKIIKRLDQEGFQESIEIVKLKYAPAADTTDKILKIFDLKGQKPIGVAAKKPSVSPAGRSSTSAQFISKIIPDERTNSLIVVANAEGLRRVKEIVKKIDQAMEDQVGTGRIHVHYLQYADAVELAGTLSGVSSGTRSSSRLSGGSSSSSSTIFPQATQPNISTPRRASTSGGNLLGKDVKITADQHTNALIITASPSDYETLLPVIHKLDVRRPQAFVEAMILEVDIDKAFDVGLAGNIGSQFGSSDSTSVFGATSFGSTSSVFLPTSPSLTQGLSIATQGRTITVPVAGGESLTIPVYGGFFRALQTNGTINVLSTPNILTRDNMEAEIVVGQVVPFITAQGRDVNNQPINQIQRENVAITLRVIPQINASDELTLDIFQETQDLVPGPDVNVFGPTTSKRSARTTVLVKDGQTITVGGLINDRIQNSVSKVPVLGDIPLLGWFFKSKSRTKRKTSLVIFMTPHIIREPEDLQEISVQKNNERRRFLRENNVREHPSIKRYNLDRELRTPIKKSSRTPMRVPADSPTGAFLASDEIKLPPKNAPMEVQ